ncbi:MAG: glycosyltransferase family 4 protein [Vicinamibacterales bacterium]
MKLALVVQRYGAEINGGAELHARYIAELLARHHDVDVLTTCARDYVTWRNEFPAGSEMLNGVTVRRFPVKRERQPEEFGRRSLRVFDQRHSVDDELAWLDSEGPTSPALIRYCQEQPEYDYFLYFSFRYYHAYHGARATAPRAILVPTAERDPAIGLSIFQPVFRSVRAVMYNSFEERRMIQSATSNRDVPGVVVGVGSDVPERVEPARFRAQTGISGPFVIYVGRIDENKGCQDLFAQFLRYVQTHRSRLSLVLIGKSILPIPDHPLVKHLGFLPDVDKFDGIAAAEALVMPSFYESLSMVALEAWALGVPVLANGACEVLRGQCIRSNAGLYYENYGEFAETLSVLEHNAVIRRALGQNGRDYFRRHYAWPVIQRKYDDMLDQLRRDERAGTPLPQLPPLPGWLARRKRDVPAAAETLASLPSGPVIPNRDHAHTRPKAVSRG